MSFMFWLAILMAFLMGTMAESGSSEQQHMTIPGESDLEHDFEECTGYLEEIRLDSDDNGPVMVVRFWTKIVQHYTRVKTLFAGLIDILFKQLKVQLRTDTCTTGDHKFESYEVLSKYIP